MPLIVNPVRGSMSAQEAGAVAITGGTITGVTLVQAAPNAQTGTTYTFVLADATRLTTLTNGSAISATIPPNSTTAFPIGSSIDFDQHGAGQVTVVAGAGVTLRYTPTLKLRAQYSSASAVKIATDEWLVVGDLAAS